MDIQLTCPMSGKRWVFTGGACAEGGFAQNQGFRAATGHFEEVIRWTARIDGDLASRENYVFNTAGSGYSVCDILRMFDDRIARFRPAAVVYITGQEDRLLSPQTYREGLAELQRQTEALGAIFFVLQDGDPLAQAGCLLETIGGAALPENLLDRAQLALEPSAEILPRSGSLRLSSEAMRWLFIGDSITHGALHTHGYDSLPQLWEKYLRGDWGRRDDMVLNTAVSGATAKEHLERLDIRYTPYADADVVIAMFGTNDCCFPDTITPEQFREHLRTIVDLAHAHGSQAVLRTPQPQLPEAVSRARAIVPFVEIVREVAQEKGTLLVDHFSSFTALQQAHPARFRALMGDAVHPNAQGQYRMFREMAYALDMVLENSMATLDYPPAD